MLDADQSRSGASPDDAHRELARAFREAGITTPALDARLLVQHVCGMSHADLIGAAGRSLTRVERARLGEFAARRLAGEPVSRLLGTRAFWGLEFRLCPDALDPRPDTETLVEAVLAAVPEQVSVRPDILDLGTGTGCILVALLHELPRATGVGTDISDAALVMARDNARRHGVAGRARFAQSDWLQGVRDMFDVVVANPPYIRRDDLSGLSVEVRDHDPAVALDGGVDGLDGYRRIMADLARVLKPGGVAAFEVGHGQAEHVREMMSTAGLRPALHNGAATMHDLAGIERVVLMRNPEVGEMAKKELEWRANRASLT